MKEIPSDSSFEVSRTRVSLNSLFCSYVNKTSRFEIATKSMEGIVFIRTFFERSIDRLQKKKKKKNDAKEKGHKQISRDEAQIAI